MAITMPLRSILWNYFTRVNKELACCNTCDREITTKGSNTSNIASHLRHHHFSDYQQMQKRKQEEYSNEHSKYTNECSNSKHYNDDSKKTDNDASATDEPTENGKEFKDPLVMVLPSSSRSEMAEVSSLLSLAMPMANINFLVDQGGEKDEALAIEVRPRERLFRVSLKT